MAIDGLDHYTINVADLERSVAFYVEVLGLEVGDRPPFDFPGAWLYCGGHPVVHLAQDRSGAEGSGALDHVAFRASDIDGIVRRLEERGVPYRRRQVPESDLRQVFVRDPDGVLVELNFREG